MRLTLAVMLTLVLASTALAQETGLATASPAAELTERVAPAPKAAPVDASIGSGVLTLVAFLGLIGGLLAHWSRDTSCRDDRSAFQSEG